MDKSYILTLLQTPRIGRKKAKLIMDLCNPEVSSISDLYEILKAARSKNKKIPILERSILESSYEKALRIIDLSEKKGVTILCESDTFFPHRYKNIIDKPHILYVKGNLETLNSEYSIAVIGTRNPSKFGIKAGDKLTKYFVEEKLTIISGLAIGCDTVAHKSCLDNKGLTVGILPSGLDLIYPKSNTKLVDEILDKHGAIVSEYELGVKPNKGSYIDRDRLQSGLSDGICIIETEIKGGTMHTYKYAVQQQRLVGVLDHPLKFQSNFSTGNQFLINENHVFKLGEKNEILNFIDEVKKNRLLIDLKNKNNTNHQTELGFDL